MEGEEAEIEEAQEDERAPPPPPVREAPKKKQCNQRIDELAMPNKRIFLALWQEHAHHFPKDKVDYLKHLLQELYAMTPEETSKYFSELRAEARALALRKKIKQKLRKFLQERKNQKKRQRAFRFFRKLLTCGVAYAATHEIPPIASLRLRYLSDVILEQLSDLRDVEVPCRLNPDKLGVFLVAVADWMAIAVERLYYAVQLKKNEEAEKEEEPKEERKEEPEFQPIATSTPRTSLENK